MTLYQNAEKKLKEKYDIDLLEEIVLARKDRAIYFVEYEGDEVLFTKIHGKSPLDYSDEGNHFTFSYLEENFCMTSKYGEIAGQQHYKNTNLNLIKHMIDESNVTFPIIINHQRFWVRFHSYTTVKKEDGSPLLASCYITDVTRYLINEELLYEKTHKDELTQLFNRYTLHYHFELYGSSTPVVGLYYDIDNFKVYNDVYGHEIGDKVLVKLSENLLAIPGDNIKSYRIGGDEFFTLIFNADTNKLDEYIKYIQVALNDVTIPRIKEKLSLSIGCVYTSGNITQKGIVFMKEADRLMYVSKKHGKNRATKSEFVVFN